MPKEIRLSGVRSGVAQEDNQEGSWRKDLVGLLASLGLVKPREARKTEMRKA